MGEFPIADSLLKSQDLLVTRLASALIGAVPTTTESHERMAELLEARRAIIPTFDTSAAITQDLVGRYTAAQSLARNLTYQRLQFLSQPFSLTLHALLKNLKEGPPNELIHQGMYPPEVRIAIPSSEPNNLWFIGLTYETAKVDDLEKTKKQKPFVRKLRSFLGLDKMLVDRLTSATFIKADADNIRIANQWNFRIETSTYKYPDNVPPSLGLLTWEPLKDIYQAIGLGFDKEGRMTALLSTPNDIDNGVMIYPLLGSQYGDHPYKSYKFTHFGSNSYQGSHRYTLAPDGYFRRGTRNMAASTIEEEVVKVLKRLPLGEIDYSEEADFLARMHKKTHS